MKISIFRIISRIILAIALFSPDIVFNKIFIKFSKKNFTICLYATENNSIIFDEELNNIIEIWISDLYKVAKVHRKPKILIINSKEINAAVIESGEVVIFSGLILSANSPEEFLAVLSHEVAHVGLAHHIVSKINLQGQILPAMSSMVLGGIASILSNRYEYLAVGAVGTMHLLERGFYRYSRSQEESADSAALSYMQKLKWPTWGLSSFFKKLSSRNEPENQFLSTHPKIKNRLYKAEIKSETKNDFTKFNKNIYKNFTRLQKKVRALTLPAKMLLKNKTNDDLYAIILCRNYKYQEALSILKQCILIDSKNSYLYELIGIIYSNIGYIDKSIEYFEKAISLNPQSITSKYLFSEMIIAHKSSLSEKKINKAQSLLKGIISDDFPCVWRLLARSYKNDVCVSICLAKESLLDNNKEDAMKSISKIKKNKSTPCEDMFLKNVAKDILILINQ